MDNKAEIKAAILQFKAQRNAVILAHNYQVEDVQLIADHLGDSLELSRLAASLPNPLIVFSGVRFMAETAKILAPQKTVLLPRIDSDCPMAAMVMVQDVLRLRAEHPHAAVVTYVNSTAEVKAVSDVCCTSSNAVAVARNIAAQEIIFLPDQNLGQYVQKHVPNKKIILFDGFCYVHHRIRKSEIEEAKKEYPNALVIAHPEVQPAVAALADEVLSTSGMLAFAAKSDHTEFIVVTEQGLLERLARENPGKSFVPPGYPRICINMKKIALIDILNALQKNIYEIKLDAEIITKAGSALHAMLQYN